MLNRLSPRAKTETAAGESRGIVAPRVDETVVVVTRRAGGVLAAPIELAESAVVHVRSWSGAKLSFVLIVILPTLFAAFYTLFWAAPRYVSEFRVAVRSVQPLKAGGLADLFGLGGMSQTGNDSSAVVQFLQSRDSFEALEKRLPMRKKLTDQAIDWPSRFHGAPDIEALTRYWNNLLDAYFETSTGTIVVRVSAFLPQDALQMANYLLADSEDLVNRMSRRAREDSVAFAEKEVAKAEARLAELCKSAQVLQDREAILDPMKSAEMNISLAAKMKEQIAQRSAELATLQMRLSPDAPSVVVAKEAISGLKRELERVEAQSTAARTANAQAAPGAERPLTTVFGAFQQLADERIFAEKAYLSALTSLETSRMEANRQQVYLATIVPPGLPQEPSFPRPLRQIGMTFLVAAALWLVGLLGVYSVREHM